MKRGFGSDNHSGVSREILEAIAAANTDHALAYGDDEWCERASKLFNLYLFTYGVCVVIFFSFSLSYSSSY